MRTANPTLSDRVYDIHTKGALMTLDGVMNKAYLLGFLVLVSTFWTWSVFGTNPGLGSILLIVGALGGLLVAIATAFMPKYAMYTTPLYSVLQGFVMGGLSFTFEASYPGIVIQAASVTFGVLFAMLALYTSGLVKVTDRMRYGIFAATGAIALTYLFSIILGFFGIAIPGIFGSGPIGIGFSLIVVGIAALNLLLDFDFIDKRVKLGAPKYMEWYSAFGLIVTLIWLYIEILRLLSKMRSQD